MASRCRLLSTTSLLLVLLILVPGPARSHGDHDHGDHDHGDHDHGDHDHDHDHDHDMEPHLDDDVEDDMDLNIDGDPELDDVDTKQPEPPAAPKVVYKAPHPIGDTYFVDSFDSGTLDNWVISKAKKEDTDEDIAKYDGKWLVEEQLDGKLPDDKGLVLKTRAKHHAIAGALTRPFHFIDKPLIVQYEVNFQNGIECGGAYVKLLSGNADLDLTKFYDKTPYTIMFGPDKCGEDYKLHFIMRHRNPKTGTYEEKHAKKSDVDLKSYYTDKKPHLYTLVLSPDNRYEILIDQTVVGSGSLLEDMTPPVNPAREIEDPDDSKPEDWDERAKIPDPDAIKPEDWDEDAPAQISDPDAVKPEGWLDDEPEYTADPEAVKPEDWDEEMDGEWEAPQVPNPTCEAAPGCGVWKAPMVSNPAYKGKWKPANIDNPNYQGVWKPRKIANPDFFEDLHPFRLTAFNAIGLELWSMTSDILFDNFIVCSERAVADQWAADSWGLKRQAAAADEPGIVMKLYQAAEERPWLWAVYVFTVALPIVLLVSFCWPSKKFGPPDESDPKKTDEPQPDDPEKEEEEAEDEEDEEEDEAEEGAGDTADGAAKKGGSDTEGGKSGEEEDAAAADEQEEKPRNKAAKSKADLEADDEQVQASDGDAGKTSPRKRKARKE